MAPAACSAEPAAPPPMSGTHQCRMRSNAFRPVAFSRLRQVQLRIEIQSDPGRSHGPVRPNRQNRPGRPGLNPRPSNTNLAKASWQGLSPGNVVAIHSGRLVAQTIAARRTDMRWLGYTDVGPRQGDCAGNRNWQWGAGPAIRRCPTATLDSAGFSQVRNDELGGSAPSGANQHESICNQVPADQPKLMALTPCGSSKTNPVGLSRLRSVEPWISIRGVPAGSFRNRLRPQAPIKTPVNRRPLKRKTTGGGSRHSERAIEIWRPKHGARPDQAARVSRWRAISSSSWGDRAFWRSIWRTIQSSAGSDSAA